MNKMINRPDDELKLMPTATNSGFWRTVATDTRQVVLQDVNDVIARATSRD